MTDKAIFTYRDKLAHERMRLNPGTRAYGHPFLDLNKGADEYVVIKEATIEVAWLDDNNSSSARDLHNT